MSNLRQRHDDAPNSSTQRPAPSSTPATDKAAAVVAREDEASISLLDILRLVGGVLVLSSALSYYVTNSSLTWNYHPLWIRQPGAFFRAWIRSYHNKKRGPLSLTPAELALYNGTDNSLPIYLAINGSVYDVSASPDYYGPGGSYHFFAGQDGTRAFVTGCFDEDVTPDLRGVEEMFLSDESEGLVDGESPGERKKRREQERRMARKKVQESVAHWEGFFAKSEKYRWVGTVKRQRGWLERMPRRQLCEAARRKRPPRTVVEP